LHNWDALNTIDVDTPTSSVLPLASISGPDFTVNWAGNDVGSGIATYDIWVSENGEAHTLWLDNTTSTSATYTGTNGNTYDFKSVATDNVGHTEAVPTTADATTTVDGIAPSSQVAALPTTLNTTDINVTWSSPDADLAHYDIFVSKDSGAYTLWLSNTTATSATYTGGIDGSTYHFYSLATDAVGNTEAAPPTADATTTLKLESDDPGSGIAIDTANSDALVD
jgi:hypothetical protein